MKSRISSRIDGPIVSLYETGTCTGMHIRGCTHTHTGARAHTHTHSPDNLKVCTTLIVFLLAFSCYNVLPRCVLQNYTAGLPNATLYVKNIAKEVTEDDLRFVYGEPKHAMR